MSVYFTVAAGGLVICLVYIFKKFRRGNQVPGPSWSLFRLTDFGPFDKPLPHLALLSPEWGGRYGGIFGLWIGTQRIVFINDLEVAMEMLLKKGNEFGHRPKQLSLEIFSEHYKDIVLCDNNEYWKVVRKVGFQALRNFMSGDQLEISVVDGFQHLTTLLDKVTEPIDNVNDYLQYMMYNIISKKCFNEEYKGLDDKGFQRLRGVIDGGNDIFRNGLFEDFFPYLLPIWKSEGYKTLLRLMDDFIDISEKHVVKHRQSFTKDSLRDILDHLLITKEQIEKEEKGWQLSDVHLRQIIFDIFVAGTDTSTSTMRWALYLLAYYPEVQEKVFQEIKDVCGQDFPPTLSQREHLVYTDATLHEIMRRGTIANLNLPHTASRDLTLSGYDIPKDTTVIVNLYAVHHDPKNWPEPLEFRPERFLETKDDELVLSPKNRAFMPFSAGPRACLGQAVAKADTFLLLCLFVQRYQFVWPADQPKPKVENFYKDYTPFGVPVDVKLLIKKRN